MRLSGWSLVSAVVCAAALAAAVVPDSAAEDVGQAAPPAAPAAGEKTPPARPAVEFKLPERWVYSAPLLAPEERQTDAALAVKDPSVVFAGGKWHVFMTIKCSGYTPMEYATFDTWEKAAAAPRTVLKVYDGKYYCAPQVFFFRPQKKWYLIYQAGAPGRKFMHVAYSTTEDITRPESWSKADWVFPREESDPRKEGGLDYWMICDQERAYFFYTNLNGKMWRLWTELKDFPRGFGHPEVALEADVFEASHTYRLKGLNKYLTVIEAGQAGRRYYKAYLADRLDGRWTPLADTQEKPFAGWANVGPAQGVEPWTDNISHGELLRDASDETMTVDPANLRFVFQGVLQKDKPGDYGKIPWRIGILTPAK